MHLTVFELPEDSNFNKSSSKRNTTSRMSQRKTLQPTREENDDDGGGGSVESKDNNNDDDGDNNTSKTTASESTYADDSIVRSKTIKFKSNGEEKDQEELDREEGEDEGEDEPIPPTLRIVGYNPKTGHKSLVVVPPQAVLEVLVNNPSDMSTEEILTKKKRHFLARHLTSKLRLEYPRNAPPELVVPWSGANFGFLGEVSGANKNNNDGSNKQGAGGKLDKNNGRPMEERPLKRKNRVMRCSMQICKLNVVVTAFRNGSDMSDNGKGDSNGGGGGGQSSDLSLNLYYGHIQESCELVISSEEMNKRLGRNVFELDEGEPRNTAIEWLCRRLKVYIYICSMRIIYMQLN
jgi:hypothetical protein